MRGAISVNRRVCMCVGTEERTSCSKAKMTAKTVKKKKKKKLFGFIFKLFQNPANFYFFFYLFFFFYFFRSHWLTLARCPSQIETITVSFDQGITALNFAEAALLIQGSACIYSKKVEYLYALVYNVFQMVSNRASSIRKHVGASINAEGNDADAEFVDDDEYVTDAKKKTDQITNHQHSLSRFPPSPFDTASSNLTISRRATTLISPTAKTLATTKRNLATIKTTLPQQSCSRARRWPLFRLTIRKRTTSRCLRRTASHWEIAATFG